MTTSDTRLDETESALIGSERTGWRLSLGKQPPNSPVLEEHEIVLTTLFHRLTKEPSFLRDQLDWWNNLPEYSRCEVPDCDCPEPE